MCALFDSKAHLYYNLDEVNVMNDEFMRVVRSVRPTDGEAAKKAMARLDSLAKPPKSLGKLETLAIRLAAIKGDTDISTRARALLVFCADNGVVAEGVSSAPNTVTLMQTMNLARGLTGAGTLARFVNAETMVYDVGVAYDIFEPLVIDRKIARGTKNIAVTAAMSEGDAYKALMTGVEAAFEAKKRGFDVLGVGEMGIGNTTTSSAVLAALTGLEIDVITGRGGGLTDVAFERKKQVIKKALAVNAPNPRDPIDVLRKVGGFDIAAMAGAYIGAAANRTPVVIDGFIGAVAAVLAKRLCPVCVEYMIPSHASCERGYEYAMVELGLEPMLLMDMRLGEGSGCTLAFMLLDAAVAVFCNMATFEQASIDDGYLAEIRKSDTAFSKE